MDILKIENTSVLVAPEIAMGTISRHEIVNVIVQNYLVEVEAEVARLNVELQASGEALHAQMMAFYTRLHGLLWARESAKGYQEWCDLLSKLTGGKYTLRCNLLPFPETVRVEGARFMWQSGYTRHDGNGAVSLPDLLDRALLKATGGYVNAAPYPRGHAALIHDGWSAYDFEVRYHHGLLPAQPIDVSLPDEVEAEWAALQQAYVSHCQAQRQVSALKNSVADVASLERRALARLTMEALKGTVATSGVILPRLDVQPSKG